MINYYFKLNEKSKKYLLKFRNDFDLYDLEDLTLYKNNDVKFYSCTHEEFNSLKFDYKDMTDKEIIDYVNDKYDNPDNSEILKSIDLLVKMDINTEFKFVDLGVNDYDEMEMIFRVCDEIHLNLVGNNNDNHWSSVGNDGNLKRQKKIPVLLCKLDDPIVKER